MEQEFIEFLKSNNDTRKFICGSVQILVSKVKYNDKLDILYSLKSYNDELFDLKSPFVYSGIYDKENNKLFDLEYSVRNYLLKWEYNDERCIDSYNIQEMINKDMNEKIRELVEDSKEDIFDLKNAELGEPIEDKDVMSDFMDGYTHNTLKDYFKEYSSEKAKNILEYLTNKESFIEEEARDFILDNHSDILKSLTISREKRKVLKQIEDNKEHPYHKIKSIIDSIRDKNYVTVNLTVNKDDKELTFKYDAHTLLLRYDTNLSSYSIDKLADRNKFEELFGRWSDFDYQDITKITYGRNTIYEDENFKSLSLEEANELS